MSVAQDVLADVPDPQIGVGTEASGYRLVRCLVRLRRRGGVRRHCSTMMSFVRSCPVCTFDNEDPTANTCAVCFNLLPSSSSKSAAPKPTSAAMLASSPGHVVCGWPLDDGSVCQYSAIQQHVNRHQREFAAHGNCRAQMRTQSETSQGRLASLFGKRQRTDEPTSTTRSSPPPPAVPAAPAAATSSTRSTPASPPTPSTSTQARRPFDEYAFDGSATTAEGRAYTERLAQEQSNLHREQAQQEGLRLMASMAQAAADAATEALSTQMQAITQQLRDLPATLVRDVPAAVRDHDEAEAHRLSTEAADSSLQQQIMAAASCVEIGKLPGFEFITAENRVVCQDCFRYSSSKDCPGDLKRGARDAGWFKGVDDTLVARSDRAGKYCQRRPMKAVRWEIKHHCRAGSIHEWCVVYASEQRKITSRSLATGLVCASLVYMNLWEHDSYRGYERRIAGQHAIGTYVGT